jgi:methionine synthase II (cobalamin-independent)
MNQIAARRELAKEKGGGKMRTYSQIKQDQLKTKRDAQVRSGQIVTVSDEYEYSHWREEFLWEVDKKYPDKVKEIKPMKGKNTITINPEDESSKYKRGY